MSIKEFERVNLEKEQYAIAVLPFFSFTYLAKRQVNFTFKKRNLECSKSVAMR